jgi:hypothetical protein
VVRERWACLGSRVAIRGSGCRRRAVVGRLCAFYWDGRGVCRGSEGVVRPFWEALWVGRGRKRELV